MSIEPIKMISLHLFTLLFLTGFTRAQTTPAFPFESDILTPSSLSSLSLSTSSASNSRPSQQKCRASPSFNWPSPSAWSALNHTLGGSLVLGNPPASSCYSNPSGPSNPSLCNFVTAGWPNTSFHADDPVSTNSHWFEGNSCMPPSLGGDGCEKKEFPAYVVKVRSVREVQIAVRWAGERGVRVVVKNTGHDFLGRSIGAYSLSIWTHNLKGFTHIPSYSNSKKPNAYTGPAAHIAAGMMSYEVQVAASALNPSITVQSPGGNTVGTVGGFFQGGGHSKYTSVYGLTADEVLAFNIVLADGRFVRVDKENEPELFWAVRGGGGGNWGVITSLTMKAHPLTPLATSAIAFSTLESNSSTAFWAGVQANWAFGAKICQAGGFGYNYIRISNSTTNPTEKVYKFTTNISIPNMSSAEMANFTAPLVKTMNDLGIAHSNPVPGMDNGLWPASSRPGSTAFGQTRQASRLIPRANFEDPALLAKTSKAIQKSVVEGGYTFHAIHHQPSLSVLPRDFVPNAVHPLYRTTAMHAQSYDILNADTGANTPAYERFRKYFKEIVDVGGAPAAYMNEADVGEPGWQQAFYGSNYAKLLRIKRDVDPDNLFWVPTGVGSEGWEVVADGRLCRVGR